MTTTTTKDNDDMTPDLIPDPAARVLLDDGRIEVRARWTGARVPRGFPTFRQQPADHFDVTVLLHDEIPFDRPAQVTVPDCHGSTADHAADVPLATQGEGLCWAVLGDVISAHGDPDEFWQLAAGGLTDLDSPTGRRQAQGILDVIAFADAHGERIEAHADAIRAATE